MGMADAFAVAAQEHACIRVDLAYSKHASRALEAVAIASRRLRGTSARPLAEAGLPPAMLAPALLPKADLALMCTEGTVLRESGTKRGVHLYVYSCASVY